MPSLRRANRHRCRLHQGVRWPHTSHTQYLRSWARPARPPHYSCKCMNRSPRRAEPGPPRGHHSSAAPSQCDTRKKKALLPPRNVVEHESVTSGTTLSLLRHTTQGARCASWAAFPVAAGRGRLGGRGAASHILDGWCWAGRVVLAVVPRPPQLQHGRGEEDHRRDDHRGDEPLRKVGLPAHTRTGAQRWGCSLTGAPRRRTRTRCSGPSRPLTCAGGRRRPP